MAYKIQILEFNTKSVPVPGYSDASYDNSQTVPIILKHVPDINGKIWSLVFISCSGNFYPLKLLFPNNNTFPVNITIHDGDIIKAWYCEDGASDNNLSIYPFDGLSDEFFDAGELFVDFSPDSSDQNVEINTNVSAWYDTDTMQSQEVTATVHADLPNSRKLDFKHYGTSTSVIIKIIDTQVLLDNIFIFYGDDQLTGNSITIKKNTTCQALAVFKKNVTTENKEISTVQYSKIPWWKWQEIYKKIIVETIKGENGEIFEYLNPRQIDEINPAIHKTVNTIDNRVNKLKK